MKVFSKKVWNASQRKFLPALLEIRQNVFQRVDWLAKSAANAIDFDDQLIFPSAIDLHVHSRDFDETHKETFASLEAGAFRGGVQAMACMANTRPRLDSVKMIDEFLERVRSYRPRMIPFAAVSQGLEGRTPTEWDQLLKRPIAGLSDDGKPILDERMMAEALGATAKAKKLLSIHEEDLQISCGSLLHRSEQAVRLGIPSSPSEAEVEMVRRDLRLAEAMGASVHFAHLSAAESVKLLKDARKRGIPFSAELTPHHGLLDVSHLSSISLDRLSQFKVCPVIRGEEDRQALWTGVLDGVIDCFASDHAPHSSLEKDTTYRQAWHGMIALENYINLYAEMRCRGEISWDLYIRATAERPAELLNLADVIGKIQEGYEANFVVFSPDEAHRLKWEASLSQNTPFQNFRVQGKLKEHWFHGEKVYEE